MPIACNHIRTLYAADYSIPLAYSEIAATCVTYLPCFSFLVTDYTYL